VSYWVDLALGQGELPRGTSLSHVKCMRWMGSRLNGHRSHDILGVIVASFMGAFVEGVLYLRLQCTFSKPIICLLSFFLSLYFLSQ
jgi:hypothetical protein